MDLQVPSDRDGGKAGGLQAADHSLADATAADLVGILLLLEAHGAPATRALLPSEAEGRAAACGRRAERALAELSAALGRGDLEAGLRLVASLADCAAALGCEEAAGQLATLTRRLRPDPQRVSTQALERAASASILGAKAARSSTPG